MCDLFGCQKKSTCFQKFKSSNVFYARARQMMPVVYVMAPCWAYRGNLMLKMIDLVPAASEVILRPPEAVF